jgi:hypothetical protein
VSMNNSRPTRSSTRSAAMGAFDVIGRAYDIQ